MHSGTYTVKTKNSAGWKKFDTGFVSISHGQCCHEGAKLDALLAWTLKSYNKAILNISDTLHRHNLVRKGMDKSTAVQKSFAMGNEWMIRNDDILKKYMPKFATTHRWNDWLSHPDFASVHADITAFFESNGHFRDAALTDIEDFTSRKAGDDVDMNLLFETSKEYLLEEIAAYIIIGRTYAASRVYPAKTMRTFQYLHDIAADLPENLKGMEKGMNTQVVFIRKKQASAQAA